eukprot:355897-Prorocentrum_lima.AAC.1
MQQERKTPPTPNKQLPGSVKHEVARQRRAHNKVAEEEGHLGQVVLMYIVCLGHYVHLEIDRAFAA